MTLKACIGHNLYSIPKTCKNNNGVTGEAVTPDYNTESMPRPSPFPAFFCLGCGRTPSASRAFTSGVERIVKIASDDDVDLHDLHNKVYREM